MNMQISTIEYQKMEKMFCSLLSFVSWMDDNLKLRSRRHSLFATITIFLRSCEWQISDQTVSVLDLPSKSIMFHATALKIIKYSKTCSISLLRRIMKFFKNFAIVTKFLFSFLFSLKALLIEN